jgi:hypothetical protein
MRQRERRKERRKEGRKKSSTLFLNFHTNHRNLNFLTKIISRGFTKEAKLTRWKFSKDLFRTEERKKRAQPPTYTEYSGPHARCSYIF